MYQRESRTAVRLHRELTRRCEHLLGVAHINEVDRVTISNVKSDVRDGESAIGQVNAVRNLFV